MWRGLVAGVLACVVAAPALAQIQTQAPLLVRESAFEHGSQSFERQDYPYANGAFFAYEVTPPDALWAPEAMPERRPQQVVAIDAITGAVRPVTQPLTKPLNIKLALNDHLISVGGDYNRVSVIRRTDGAVLGEKRLNQRVHDALVEGDTLYLLQDEAVARFRLPGMVFLGETRLPDAFRLPRPRFVDGKVVSVKSDAIEVRSLLGAVAYSIPLPRPCPPVAHDPGYESAVGGHYIVARTGCRHVTVFDIRQGRRVFDLPDHPESERLSIAIAGEFVFVRALNSPMPTPVSVFDLASGRELARVAIPNGMLSALGDRLIVWSIDELVVPPETTRAQDREVAGALTEQTQSRRLTVSVYRPDAARLRDPVRADTDLRAAIAAAQAADNPYRAIDLLESVSPYPMQQALDSGNTAPWRDATLFYARSMSLSQTRVAKGAAMLDRLSMLYPEDDSIKAIFRAAQQRGAILDTDSSVREPVLASLWASADKRPLALSRTAAQGATGELDWDAAQIHENRIYVPCRNCSGPREGGIQIFDRRTLRPVAVLPAPTTSFGSLEVNSIVFTSGRMFAGLNLSGYASEEPNVVAYDLRTLSLIKAWNAVVTGTDSSTWLKLAVRGDVVGAYDCRYAPAAKGFVAATLAEAPAPFESAEICGYWNWRVPSIAPGLSSDLMARAEEVDARIAMAGRKFLVGTQGDPWVRIDSKLFLREGDTRAIALPRTLPDQAGLPAIAFTSEEDLAITPAFGSEVVFYSAFDIAAQRDTTLIDIRVPYPRSYMASDGRTLFAGFGASLLAIDMRSGDVLDFAEVFAGVSGGPRVRTYPITTVKIDDNTLLVGSTAAVAAFDLKKFYSSADASKTPFAETRRILSVQ